MKLVPWSICPLNRQPNISLLHSIPGQSHFPLSNKNKRMQNKKILKIMCNCRNVLACRNELTLLWLNLFMNRLLVFSSICQIWMKPFSKPIAIRFAEIHSTLLITFGTNNDVWKWLASDSALSALPFPLVFHNNNFLLVWKMKNN